MLYSEWGTNDDLAGTCANTYKAYYLLKIGNKLLLYEVSLKYQQKYS